MLHLQQRPSTARKSSNLRHLDHHDWEFKAFRGWAVEARDISYDAQESSHKDLSDQNVNNVRMINPSWQAPITPIQKLTNTGNMPIRKAQENSTHFVCWEMMLFPSQTEKTIQAYHQEDTNGGQLVFCLFFKSPPSLASAPKRSLNSGSDSQIPKWRYRT